MRINFLNNNAIRVFYNKRIIYLVHKNLLLTNKDFIKHLIKLDVITQERNYVILSGTGYNISFIFFDDINNFLEGCRGAWSLNINIETILETELKKNDLPQEQAT